MKVLLISHARNDENAGASRVYHLLAEGLRKKGHVVTLYHYDDLRVPKFLNYFVLRAGLPEFILWRFYKEATQGYDVVFCSNGMAWRIFRKLKSLPVRPWLVHHIHGLTFFDYQAVVTEKLRGHVKPSPLVLALKSRFAIKWDEEGARYADVIAPQNLRDLDYVREERRREVGPDGVIQPMIQVPAALHPSIEAASHTATPPEQRDPLKLLWFGSWRERKGNYYVNRAFREVKEKFPAATLTLGGCGGDASSVPDFFDPELRSSIRVLPRIDVESQLREYNSHSLFLFPSLSEGFGLALIEAMAMGLACVTTQTGVGSDWIVDGEHAAIVTMASSEHLARGILRLLEDDALRIKVARNGQKLAQGFTVERCVEEYLEIFERRSQGGSRTRPEAGLT